MNHARILIVDNDPVVADSLAEFLRREGHESATAYDAIEALAILEQTRAGRPDTAAPFALVITDVAMPGMDGMELLRSVLRAYPGTAVVMLTGYGSIESAVEALRIGASDYLTKPVVDAELRVAVERALRQHTLMAENLRLRKQLDTQHGLDAIVGADHRMQKIYQLIEAVAPSRTTVLMTGESGTGKSMVARAIHLRSPRRDGPFVELACGSIPETLLESELFGHVKGAFTGAHADKVGKFLAADGGTIFLDEINSASPAMQLKLLRVLQERRFEPVGGTQTVEVDVRIVLAGNQPLEDLVAAGAFRQDLYYRINVVKIELPPLRERVGDIPLLAETFLARFGAELGKQLVGFTPEALDALRKYHYPGNVRELQNIIERAAVLGDRPTIGLDDLPPEVVHSAQGILARLPSRADADDTPWRPMPLEEALREPERNIILKALKANGFNRQKTADELAINRTTLYKKMKQLDIDPGDERIAG
ncbi:MAG: sigma-54-dependent Fis family transcriptional regulator [Phycisphaeraceae bacterium]|nr:sigma-54-dependent Fis family transcriptional regulator [Phycisphaeraceae bacterium]MCW5755234.1 sigma-54-dependent Fis family transcriptional regulator [Phycisphaeraceae bacterium]